MEKQLPTISVQSEPIVQEYLKTLMQGGKSKEVEETKELLEYLGTIDQELTELIQEVTSSEETIQTLQNPGTRSCLTVITDKLKLTVNHTRELFEKAKDSFRTAVKQSVGGFKSKGKHAVIKTVDTPHFKQALQYVGHSLAAANGVVGAFSSKVTEVTTRSRNIRHSFKNIGRIIMDKDAVPLQNDTQKLNTLQRVRIGLYKKTEASYQETQSAYKKLDGLDKNFVKKDLKQIGESKANDAAFLEKALPKDKGR